VLRYHCLNVDVREVPMGDESTSSDIKLLFQQELAALASVIPSLPPDWPGEATIQQLVDLPGDLFIWATTTILFIESGFVRKRLERVLSAHDPSHNRLDGLYRNALTSAFEAYGERHFEAVHSILGAIVVAREPLTEAHLSRLLGLSLDDV